MSNEAKQPSEKAMYVAGGIWTEEATKNKILDVELAVEFAKVIDKYREAIICMSGIADFSTVHNGEFLDTWIKIRDELL